MSSSKTLVALLAVLCLAPVARTDPPNDSKSSRKNNDDLIPSQDIPREIGGKTYEHWKEELKHPDPSVRANAITVMPLFRDKAMDAIPIIVDRTHDQDASPRAKAVLALGMMDIRDTDKSKVVDALGKRVTSDSQAIVRYEAAKVLASGRFKPEEVRRVIGDLVRGIGDTSTWELRQFSIRAIMLAGVDEKTGPDARVTDALILRTKAFNEPAMQVRLYSIMALGAQGRPQDPSKLRIVYGALKDNYSSRNIPIKIWSHVSVMALEDKVNDKDMGMIADYLKHEDRDVRYHALSALGALQGKSHEYIGRVLETLQREKETSVQQAGCRALGRMGDKSDKVLRTLIRFTESDKRESVSVVLEACQAFAQLGANTPEVMDAMNKVLDHRSMDVQTQFIVKQLIEEAKKPKVVEDKKKEKDNKGKGENAPKRGGNR